MDIEFKSFSRRMTLMSFVAMFAVIMIHSVAVNTCGSAVSNWNRGLQGFVCRSLTSWAIPFFYLASGFWFGRSDYVDRGGLLGFWGKKFRTLLLPYLCWSVIGFLMALPLIVVNNHMAGGCLWERTVVTVQGGWSRINWLFGITYASPQGNYPLWFLRTLIVLFLFAPLWRLLLRLRGGRWLLVGFSLVQYFVYPIYIRWYFYLLPMALLWFVVGMILSRFHVERFKLNKWAAWGCVILWLVSASGVALLKYGGVGESVWLRYAFGHMVAPLGILTFWWICSMVESWWSKPLPWVMGETFWVYCFHEVVCQYLLSGGRYLMGKNDVSTLSLMVVTPFAAMVVCCYLAVLCKRFFPRALAILSGGRG